ncbi:hypothetical protein COOONC_25522, partial [Cooperia oncophora]
MSNLMACESFASVSHWEEIVRRPDCGYGDHFGPERIEWWAFSCMSFAMILATVTSMIGLSNNKNFLLLPHLCLLFIFCLFAARVLAGVVAELDYSEPNWTFRIAVLALAGKFAAFAPLALPPDSSSFSEIFLFCSLF